MCSISATEKARERIRAAYDPELLRSAGHRLVDLLADHLSTVESVGEQVLPWFDPAANVRRAADVLGTSLPDDAGRDALAK